MFWLLGYFVDWTKKLESNLWIGVRKTTAETQTPKKLLNLARERFEPETTDNNKEQMQSWLTTALTESYDQLSFEVFLPTGGKMRGCVIKIPTVTIFERSWTCSTRGGSARSRRKARSDRSRRPIVLGPVSETRRNFPSSLTTASCGETGCFRRRRSFPVKKFMALVYPSLFFNTKNQEDWRLRASFETNMAKLSGAASLVTKGKNKLQGAPQPGAFNNFLKIV